MFGHYRHAPGGESRCKRLFVSNLNSVIVRNLERLNPFEIAAVGSAYVRVNKFAVGKFYVSGSKRLSVVPAHVLPEMKYNYSTASLNFPALSQIANEIKIRVVLNQPVKHRADDIG